MKTIQRQLEVKSVILDKQNQTPIIMLKEIGTKRILPVTAGPFETSAVIIELEGMRPPRPLTHDLLSYFFLEHGFTLEGVYFYGYSEDSFLAQIHYRKGLRRYSKEVRPSDGIALAVRLKAPMFVTEEILSSDVGNRLFLEAADPETAEYLYLGRTEGITSL